MAGFEMGADDYIGKPFGTRELLARMKNVMRKRPYFLWGFVQEQFKLTDAEMIRYFGERPPNLGS